MREVILPYRAKYWIMRALLISPTVKLLNERSRSDVLPYRTKYWIMILKAIIFCFNLKSIFLLFYFSEITFYLCHQTELFDFLTFLLLEAKK